MEHQAPFRHRHDGWTPERRLRFCAELARTGCLRDACRAVGLSKTSAYRAYKRMPDFAAQWDEALESERPILMQAAFDRAVNGVEEPVVSAGKVVATQRTYPNALLRFLIEREDRRRERTVRAVRPPRPLEEVRHSILSKLNAIEEQRRAEERERALAHAERMRAEGWAP